MKKRLIFIYLIILLLVISLISAFSFPNIFNFQKQNSNKNQLKVTHEHPFLVNNKWIKAEELKIGDELTIINGKRARITSIKEIQTDKPISVYNLNIAYPNTFVVNSIIVHNKPMGVNWDDHSLVKKVEPTSQTEIWDDNVIESSKIIESRMGSGLREGIDILEVNLRGGGKTHIVKKEYNLKELTEYLQRGTSSNYINEKTVKEKLFEQIKRVKETDPNWAPLGINFNNEKVIIYMESYDNVYLTNSKWDEGNWNNAKNTLNEDFYENLNKGDINLRKKFKDKFSKLTTESDRGVPILSDAHNENIMIWTKRDSSGNIVDFEIRPIDHFDPFFYETTIFSTRERRTQMIWIENELEKIVLKLFLTLI